MTINLEKSLEISAPVQEVFALWADFASYPRFMPQFSDVRFVDTNHWEADMDGQTAHIEVTEDAKNQSISWQLSAPDFKCFSTIRLEPASDGAATKVIYTAHFPNGIGQHSTTELTSDMETSLEQFAQLLQGDEQTQEEGEGDGSSDNIDTGAFTPADPYAEAQELTDEMEEAPLELLVQPAAGNEVFADITASTAALQQTFTAATQGWTSTVVDAFNQINSLLWAMFDWPKAESPKFDVKEENGALIVTSQLPGYTAENLHVEIQDGRLLISGERQEAQEAQAGSTENSMAQATSKAERFHESLPLPKAIDSREVEAELTENGVLQITLPILQQAPAEAETTAQQ